MELHENLYALGLRLGREVFEDPDSFRGALDDFLDEDSATTGDINLLVDAVRLGGFTSMTSMIGSGAQVTAAVEEAGSRLARDRGSADVAGAQWACAVLGFAIGKVSDADVRRYRTQHASPQPASQPLPPTQFPGQQYPGMPGTGGPPAGAPPMPTAQPSYTGGLPTQRPNVPPPSSWSGQPTHQQRKRKAWPIVVAAVAAIAIIAGGTVALILSRDDDGGGGSGGGGKETEKVDELPTDLPAVSERYTTLAGDVSVGLDECETATPSDGVTEQLSCTFADGTLELSTYETVADLEAVRSSTVTTNPGTLFSENGGGTFYAEDAGSAVGQASTSSVYWDKTDALQSGKYVASSDVEPTQQLDDLKEQFATIDSPVTEPKAPEDDGMVELAKEFIKLGKCNRIPTIQAGELEESICTGPKGIFIFMGVFENSEDFKAYRQVAIQAGTDQGYPLRNWNFGGGAREGAAAEYKNDSGEAVRYWDRPGCKCYMEANLSDGDLEALEKWWVNA
jgi:hypothetical protein